MKINSTLSINRYANIFVLILFPGFFFYNILLSKGLIPSIPYMAIVPIFITVIFTLFSALNISMLKNKFFLEEYLFFSFLSLCLSLAFLNFIFSPQHPYSTELFIWSIGVITQQLATYFLGKYLNFNETFKIYHILIFILITILVLSNINFSNPLLYLALSEDNENAANYMSIGNVILVTSCLCVVFINKPIHKLIFATLAIFLLILIGARSDLIAFTFALIASIIINSKNQYKLIILPTIAILMLILINNLVYIAEILPPTRLTDLIVNASKATSLQGRSELLDNALNTISNNWFLGDYGSYAQNGSIGSYAHNFLSAWVNLGLLGFTVYCLIIFIFIKNLFIKKSQANLKLYRFMILILTICIMMMLGSKAYSYMHIGLGIGLIANYKRQQ